MLQQIGDKPLSTRTATPEDGLELDNAGAALSCGCLIITWLCLGSFELDMASCGSSTYEGASDVSLFHTRFTFPPCTCRSVVWFLVFGFWCLVVCLVCCVCFLFAFVVFCKCWEGVLTIPPRVLDDRQCFTARSARLKKKIVKRNRTWLAKTPVQRDPAMFNATECEDGHASRDMSYKIQKWNVNSTSVFPILLANTRVDWLGLEDAEITQHFQVLREGILRDVFTTCLIGAH